MIIILILIHNGKQQDMRDEAIYGHIASFDRNEIAEFLDIVSIITSQDTEKLGPDSIIESVIKSSIN